MTPDVAEAPSVLSARGVGVVVEGHRGGALRRRLRGRGLEEFTADVSPGEVIHVVGDRLSGVVEALEVLSGRRAPDAGQVLIDGTEAPADRRSRAVWGSRVAVLGEPVARDSGRRTVLASLADRVRAGDPEAATSVSDSHRARAADILDAVGLDEAERERRVRDVPGDLVDRLRLARLLALGPGAVVVATGWEPDGADAELAEAVLSELRAAGTAIVRGSDSLPTSLDDHERVLVMCGGRVVEVLDGPGLDHPLHPWTRALAAGAEPIGERSELGDPGCPFRGRCDRAQSRCAEQMPDLTRPLGAGHPVACWFPEDPRRGPRAGAGPDAAGSPGLGSAAAEANPPEHGDEPTAHEFVEG